MSKAGTLRTQPFDRLRSFDKLRMIGPFDRLRSFDKLRMSGPFDRLRANGVVCCFSGSERV
ncbi:hypothetical protein ASE08_28680 [Rhizobacter sp. Root16D2]|nr:hypothetical protein ASC98_16720 [Rhizobacter sp. Root1238]KRB12455.1 hypothetical protein ASE08_28680 [Rhizobacter sp. Root16D2]